MAVAVEIAVWSEDMGPPAHDPSTLGFVCALFVGLILTLRVSLGECDECP